MEFFRFFVFFWNILISVGVWENIEIFWIFVNGIIDIDVVWDNIWYSIKLLYVFEDDIIIII